MDQGKGERRSGLPTTESWLDTLQEHGVSDDLALAAALVARAGAIGEALLASGQLRRTTKTGVADVVTQADRRAEAEIVAALDLLRPADGVLGEEGASRESRSGRTWIVDPIDGTYNFSHRISGWCSAVGLREGRQVIAAAVQRGERRTRWTAGREGSRLVLRRNGEQLGLLPDADLAQVCVATHIPTGHLDNPGIREPLLRALAGAATIRMLGSSSLDLADVATGRIGAYLQANTRDWDWYPGIGLVRAAGGVGEVVEFGGQRWHCAGSPRAVAQLVARLRGR